MDVSDEEVSDKNGCLSRSMTIKAINTIMTKRIWISRVASEIVFQLVHSDTGAPLHGERVITVRKKPNVHSELYQRNVTVEGGHPIVSYGSQHVTLHVLLTAETKDPINEGLLVEMPKDATLINAARPEVLSARPDFCHISDVSPKNAEEVKARRRQTRLTPWFQQYTCDDSESQGV